MHKRGEMVANVRRQGQPVRKWTTRTRGLTATKIGANITSSSTYPLLRFFRPAVGWRFAHGHPLAFQVPSHHRPRSSAGAAFCRHAGRGGVHS